MSYLSKEQLQSGQERNVDDIALQEVESYIEKVEGQTERSVSDNQTQQSQTGQIQQQSQLLVSQSSGGTLQPVAKKIVLPIDEHVMRIGLGSKPSVGIKWLAEWCLMMIKKYPGRVFYSPTNTYD